VAASELAPIVVCDAGPLIHLDELKCLELLSDYPQILVPEVVWQEVLRHRPSALRQRRLLLTRVKAVPKASAKLTALIATMGLDPGEEAALCLMQQVPTAMLLTDDEAARQVANHLSYTVHGTLGVLLLAWQRGLKSRRQILRLLQTMHQRSTLHVSRKLLNTIIARVHEEGP
jgi:predicted nucleic acid-binding protein